ncbi:3-deoxy-8-phosphooctulonate synthase [bacterium]|nr:3-deoxy-8-phosphooctulonate synthase [bacterium]
MTNSSLLDGKELFLIAGPCVLESLDISLHIGEKVKSICEKHQLPYVFKASFDKANRTSGKSLRGPGLEKGLEMLAKIKSSLGIPVLTDVHESNQVKSVAQVADILQIPAFLCRQTDLLIEVGNSGKAVNIKKGQFLAPEDMKYAVEKVKHGGDVPVSVTERGTSFGYRDLVVDLRSIEIMRKFAPVIFDATHAVQSPGGAGGKTGGNRSWVPLLVRGAIAAGIDGLFLEVHTNPESSPSDGANMITPETLEQHLPQWIELDNVVRNRR